ARVRADRLDGGAAFAQHDLGLAFALDKDRLLDTDRAVLAVGPGVGLNGGLIRQFLMQLPKDLFAGDFGGEMAQWRYRHLVFRIVERSGVNITRQRLLEFVDAI